jgi:hypothetical protein
MGVDWATTPIPELTFDDMVVFQLCMCDKNNNKQETRYERRLTSHTGAMKGAAVVPRAKMRPWANYPCQYPKNQKVDTKSTLKKTNPMSGISMSDLSNDTKKYTPKSRETIPLQALLDM